MKESSNKYKSKDLALIAGSMASLYKEGIVFNSIFDLLLDLPIAECYKKSLQEIKGEINKGESLESAFGKNRGIYTDFFISLVGVGEKTGRIAETLEGLELFYNKIWFVKKTIIDTLTYPVILVTAMNGVFIFLILVVIPNFADIFTSMDKKMPEAFQYIINLKNYIHNNTLFFLISLICWGIIIPLILFKYFLKERIMKLLNNSKTYKAISEYIIIILLEVIMKSGINLSKGLIYCSEMKISYSVTKALKNINNKIMKGFTLYETMESEEVFSKFTLAYIKMGEEGGALENILKKLENRLFSQIEGNIKRKTAMLQPILIMSMGAIVVIFMLIFILPIFNTLLSGTGI